MQQFVILRVHIPHTHAFENVQKTFSPFFFSLHKLSVASSAVNLFVFAIYLSTLFVLFYVCVLSLCMYLFVIYGFMFWGNLSRASCFDSYNFRVFFFSFLYKKFLQSSGGGNLNWASYRSSRGKQNQGDGRRGGAHHWCQVLLSGESASQQQEQQLFQHEPQIHGLEQRGEGTRSLIDSVRVGGTWWGRGHSEKKCITNVQPNHRLRTRQRANLEEKKN